jgi:hypothetical protein
MCGVASVCGPERCCLERKRQAAVRACSGEEARRGLRGEYRSPGLAHKASQRTGQVCVIGKPCSADRRKIRYAAIQQLRRNAFGARSSCLIVPRVSNDRPSGYWNTELYTEPVRLVDPTSRDGRRRLGWRLVRRETCSMAIDTDTCNSGGASCAAVSEYRAPCSCRCTRAHWQERDVISLSRRRAKLVRILQKNSPQPQLVAHTR